MTTLSTLVTPGNVLTATGTQAPTNKNLTGSGNTFPVLGGATGFVASGAIGNGATVGINADGTVSVVVGVDDGSGTPVVFNNTGLTFYIATTFDSNSNKVVIAYHDNGNSGYGTAIVGTVSGTSITFGAEVVFASASSNFNVAAFDSINNKVVIVYQDVANAQKGTAIVGTVSGTSISFGTEVAFSVGALAAAEFSIAFDSANGRVVIAYQDSSNAGKGTAIVGTVSGTAISFGTPVVFETSNNVLYTSTTFDSVNNKVVISCRDNQNSGYGTAVVGTVSGTSISFGTPVVFESADTNYISSTFDSANGKVVIAYQDSGNSGYGTAVVGTVSGTSISFGTPVVFESASVSFKTVVFDSANGKVVITYQDSGNSNYGTAIVGTVSGTSIAFGTPIVVESSAADFISSVFDSNSNKVVSAYRDSGNSSYGTSVVFQTASTNAPSYIGLSTQAVSDTDAVTVTTVAGINESQTGLTPDTLHYVNDDGTLTTTATNTYAGKAVSATKLLVKG